MMSQQHRSDLQTGNYLPRYVDKSPFYDYDIDGDGTIWAAEDIAAEIWARLGKARRAIGASSQNNCENNPWITWVKPTKRVPECGFMVYAPGRIRKRKEFAQFVITILGKHFRLSSWVRKHGGTAIFDTEELGRPDNFFENLDALTDRLTEIAVQIDKWTRNGTLEKTFPEAWVGMTRFQVFASLLHDVANRQSSKRR